MVSWLLLVNVKGAERMILIRSMALVGATKAPQRESGGDLLLYMHATLCPILDLRSLDMSLHNDKGEKKGSGTISGTRGRYRRECFIKGSESIISVSDNALSSQASENV